MNKIRTKTMNSVRWGLGMISALLVLFGAGCSDADHAMTLGEVLEVAESSEEAQRAEEPAQEAQTSVCVYVCGAVLRPGVVELSVGSRCNDALEAAGGFAQNAAREAVNLAEPVRDGMQIYFPTIQEQEEQLEAADDAGLVNINTAGVEGLCTLPGIGEAKAHAIISYREQNGGYEAIEDIMKVPGIKESAYSQIKDLIIVK